MFVEVIFVQFADRLGLLMKSKCVSNYQLAKSIGCHQSNVAYWLAGDRVPQPRMRKAIADYFGVSVSWLMGESGASDLLLLTALDNGLLTDDHLHQITNMGDDSKYRREAERDAGTTIDRPPTDKEKAMEDRTRKVMDDKKSPAPEGAELSEARMKLLAAIDGMSEDEVLAMVQMAEAAKKMRGEGK